SPHRNTKRPVLPRPASASSARHAWPDESKHDRQRRESSSTPEPSSYQDTATSWTKHQDRKWRLIKLLEEVHDSAPGFRILELDKGFQQGEPIGRGDKGVDRRLRDVVGGVAIVDVRVGQAFKEERDRDL